MIKKIALVGIGKIARDQHVPAIEVSTDWQLAATVSRHGSVPGVDAYTDLAAMLAERPDIEVVSLCLPPAPRYDYAVSALAARRHLMLEKPPGATLAECHALEALARDAGISIYATWHSRAAAQVDAARDWLVGRRLRRLRVTWKEDVRRWHPGQDWIWQPGGLGVFDPGINALSIVTAILPGPLRLAAAELFFPENRATPIAASLAFDYPGADALSAEFDWRQQGEQTWAIEAVTDDGRLLLSEGGAKLAIDGDARPSATAAGNPLGGEYPRLYAKMAALVDRGASDMDLAPMVLVADAFLLGERRVVEAFVD